MKDVLINLVLKWWISFVSITEYLLHPGQIPIETDHHNIRVMMWAKEIRVGEDTIFKYFFVFQHSANPRFCDTVNCSDRAPIRSCFTLLFSVKGISLTNKDRRMPSPNYKKPEDDKGQVWSPLMAPLVTLVVAPWCTPWWPLVNPCSLRTMPRKPFHDGPSFATQLPPLLCWSWLWRWLCQSLKLVKSHLQI